MEFDSCFQPKCDGNIIENPGKNRPKILNKDMYDVDLILYFI